MLYRSKDLLLIATLVASLTKKLAVLLLGHTLATLLNNGTHEDLTKMDLAVKLKEQPDSCAILAEFGITL